MADWDTRYREGFYSDDVTTHNLLVLFAHQIKGSQVIDVAMGMGRDAIYLARKGYFVVGIEKSQEAIKLAQETIRKEGPMFYPVRGDVSMIPIKAGSADCITVFYFLLKEAVPNILDLLRPGGLLIYETYLKRQNNLGLERKMNPAYLLDDGELLRYLKGFDLLFYEEVIVEEKEGRRKAVARAVGRKK